MSLVVRYVGVDQLGDRGPHAAHVVVLAPHQPGVGEARTGHVGSQPAALGAERVDALEQQVLALRGQVAHQSLGRPGGGLGRVKSGFLQGLWPILAQVYRNVHQLGRRVRAVLRKVEVLNSSTLGWSSS